MFTLITAMILVSMALTLVRSVTGPTVFDRILSVNMFTTKTTVLIVVLGFLTERPHFTDIAMIYPLLSFIGTIALLKYLEHGDLAGADFDDHDQPDDDAS